MRNWKTWLKCAAVRSIKTVCQTAIATIGTATVLGDVNWTMVISASILAGILSILTSLAGLPEVNQMIEDVEDYEEEEDDEEEDSVG